MNILDYRFAEGYTDAVGYLAAKAKKGDDYTYDKIDLAEMALNDMCRIDRWVVKAYVEQARDEFTGKGSKTVYPCYSKSWLHGFWAGCVLFSYPDDPMIAVEYGKDVENTKRALVVADELLTGDDPVSSCFVGPMKELYDKEKEKFLTDTKIDKKAHVSVMNRMTFESIQETIFDFYYNIKAVREDGTVDYDELLDYTDEDTDKADEMVNTLQEVRAGFDSYEDFMIAVDDYMYHPNVDPM